MYAVRSVVRRTRRVLGANLCMRQKEPCQLVHHAATIDGVRVRLETGDTKAQIVTERDWGIV
jgi:hypothetical protein